MKVRFLVMLVLVSCKYPKLVYRHRNVYESEINQYHNWSVSQAAHLRRFIEESCECGSGPEGDPFATSECENAAEYVLTVEYRAEWHRQMSLWNAGVIQQEPPKFPPGIPPLSCPLPAKESPQ